jgi:hypothetical protein
VTAATDQAGEVPWSCPAPDTTRLRYVHFTTWRRAYAIVSDLTLAAGTWRPVCAVPESGRIGPAVNLVDAVGFMVGPSRVSKEAAVLFTPRPPDLCAPTEAQWWVRQLLLRWARVVDGSEGRGLLDGRLRFAFRRPDGRLSCRRCAFAGGCLEGRA